MWSIVGFLALSGVSIPGEIYAWTVVFILPVNSAINPILYTISSIKVMVSRYQDSSWNQDIVNLDDRVLLVTES